MSDLVRPWQPIKELGLTEIVGVDEQVAQNEFAGSFSVDLPGKNPISGEFLSWAIYSTGGDELAIDANLFLLDADPAVAVGDTAMTVAEWKTVLAEVPIVNSAFAGSSAAAGNFWYTDDERVPFHALKTLYFALLLTSATTINSAGGDNELIQLNAWYRQES